MRINVHNDGPEVQTESDSILFSVVLTDIGTYDFFLYDILASLKSALPTYAEPAEPGDQPDGASLFNLRLSYI